MMKLVDEIATDEIDLASVFARQLAASMKAKEIAVRLYEARALYLGGMLLPWIDLTPGQQRRYQQEAETLIRGDVDDLNQRDKWADDYQARNGEKA